MSIPLATNHGADGAASNVNALLSISPEAKARIRALVVDDDLALRETCGSLLRNEGYDVTTCARGQQALDVVKRQPFDIALLDLYMSQVDGLTLLRAALATNPDLIAIMMTVALLFPDTTVGIMAASITRRPWVPLTRSSVSTTAIGPGDDFRCGSDE